MYHHYALGKKYQQSYSFDQRIKHSITLIQRDDVGGECSRRACQRLSIGIAYEKISEGYDFEGVGVADLSGPSRYHSVASISGDDAEERT